jgi:hypothetical protein
VAGCVNNLGVSCRRIADKGPVPNEPHGLYRWLSHFSPVIGWFHTTCLGLERHEKTSYTPVKMNWLFSALPEYRVWFLRGKADSDGTVAVRNKVVNIYTAPNSALVNKLFNSLGVPSRIGYGKGIAYVTLSAPDSMKLRIFNPEIETHRGALLR